MIGFDIHEHAARTDVGVRRSHNQDAFGVSIASDAVRWHEHGHLFIVADGMGGHAVGEKAAAKAARDIPHLISKSTNDAATALRKAYGEANAGIHSIGQENPEFRGLGTTATCLWLRPDGAWIAHVGDSRAYRLRDGYLEQLTFDHSAVWEIARRQGIRPEQLQGVKSNVILRSLGPEATVEVDVEGPHPYKAGDTFLLCSDGLSGQLSDYEIGAILASLPAAEACEFLIELANLRGGPDNCTVVVVRLSGEADPPPAPVQSVRFAKARKQWPLVVMIAAVVLACVAVALVTTEQPESAAIAFAFSMAALIVGLCGLMWKSKHPDADDTAEEPPPLHVYQRTSCKVESSLIDKLVRAQDAVREQLPEAERTAALDEVKSLLDLAMASRAAGDFDESFRSYCRVMHVLVRRFNRLRQKAESFSPVWDKHG